MHDDAEARLACVLREMNASDAVDTYALAALDRAGFAVVEKSFLERATHMERQLDTLFQFIGREVPNEPSRKDESAVDCAIRLIQKGLSLTVTCPACGGERNGPLVVGDDGHHETAYRETVCARCNGKGRIRP
jgi:DnaJ-class molecular chaperone